MSFLRKQKFLYQFGDPIDFESIQGPDSFLFSKTAFQQSINTSIKNRSENSDFADGQVDFYGQNLAILDGNNLTVNFTVPADYDLDYLKKIFIRKKKKVYFYEKYKTGYRFYCNYARYISGLDGDAGDRVDADPSIPINQSITFLIEDPKFIDITNEINILDHTVLDNQRYGWEQDIPGAGWEQDPGFGWEEDIANYKLAVKDLTQDQIESYIGKYCDKPKFYLNWTNTWIGEVDVNNNNTVVNTVNTTLTTNNKTFFSLVDLDLSGSDNNRIFKIQLNQVGGLSQNEGITIENAERQTGFTFTWLDIGNSSENILINTTQDYVYDLDKQRIINPVRYSLQLAKNNYNRYLEVESSLLPALYPNPNLVKPEPVLTLQKNTSANLTVYISNLKTYYI